MAKRSLSINLTAASFPELGLPNSPETVDSLKGSDFGKTIKGKKKDDLIGYTRSVARAQKVIKSGIENLGGVVSRDQMSLTLDYEEGVPHTYKFMGMDVDSDYRAIIPFGDGYVVVAPLVDKDKIKDDIARTRRFDDNVKSEALAYLKTCSDVIFRKISTAMKTGILYDMYKSMDSKGSFDLTDSVRLVDLVKDDIQYGQSAESALDFRSIVLTLIHEEKKKVENLTGQSSDNYTEVTCALMSSLFQYWRTDVVEKYKIIHKALSEIDLWSSLYKECIGENDFNRRFSKCIDIIAEDGEIVPGNISFSGIARNGDIMDADTFRDSAQVAIENLERSLQGRSADSDPSFMQDLMLGMIDYEMFDNPYELTESEIQALSSYDSLKNVDSDAKVCMESYNMDDPEERGMFLKSAIRSYERNFKEFKPQENYEVTEALSNMIENGERFKNRIVPDETYDGEDTSVYVVTSTEGEIKIQVDKKAILKAAKLSEKILKSLVDMF